MPKKLIVEIMGKHSNIIFCSEDGTIIDSIKHVSAQMSSVREVLPGRKYFIPDTMHKKDPLTTEWKEFSLSVNDKPMSVAKALYTSFTGSVLLPQRKSVILPVSTQLFRQKNTVRMFFSICIPSLRSICQQ
mgnify:FL=1